MYAEKLKEKIKADGISKYRAAVDMGVNPQTVSNWLAGTHEPRGIYRKVLMEYLGEKV